MGTEQSMLVVRPGDGGADWRLRLGAAAPHHERLNGLLLAWEKSKIQNAEYPFYRTCVVTPS